MDNEAIIQEALANVLQGMADAVKNAKLAKYAPPAEEGPPMAAESPPKEAAEEAPADDELSEEEAEEMLG